MLHLRFAFALCFIAATGWAANFSSRFEELKSAATPAQLYRLLYDTPKGGDLHNHSGGSNLPEWTFAVLTDPQRNGGDAFYTRVNFAIAPDAVAPQARFHTIRRFTYENLPAATRAEYTPLTQLDAAQRQAWCDAFRLDAPGEGRAEFFDVIWKRFGDVLRNPQVRVELLAQNAKAFAAEGLCYLETQFGPDGLFTNDGRPVSAEEAAAIIRARLAAPDVAATGLVVRLQDSVQRFSPFAEKQMRDQYAFISAHRDLWVGLNLVGIEERGPGFPLRFLDTLRALRRQFPTLPLALHAGEMDGPDRHIRDTLLLGASRIGHGTNLIKDPDTLLLLQQGRRVLVEVSLISNRLLEYVPDVTQHPFAEYLRTGVPVCLNTDDRGMWDSNLTDEYFTAVTAFHLSWDEVVALGRMSLEHAFVEPEVKQRLLADYATRIAAFEARHGQGSVADALRRIDAVPATAYGYAKRTWGLTFP